MSAPAKRLARAQLIEVTTLLALVVVTLIQRVRARTPKETA